MAPPAGARGPILVCGGAVVDCIVRPFDPAQRGASRTSLPGEGRVSLGGVGRNIAEVVVRLGGEVSLLSTLGDDNPGRNLLASCRSLGIAVAAPMSTPVPGARTATYTALLDGGGELVGAIADMSVFDSLGPDGIDSAKSELTKAGLVVCDGNLGGAALERLLHHCRGHSVPAWFEPVSVAKAERGRCPKPWHLVSPNWDELLALMGRPSHALASSIGDRLPDGVLPVLADALSSGLAEHVLLTMGPLGIVLASLDSAGISLPASREIHLAETLQNLKIDAPTIPSLGVRVERVDTSTVAPGRTWRCLWYRLLRPLDHVRDVTGAGDSLVGGAARAFAAGVPLEEALVVGMACAHLTLFSDGAVSPFLTPDVYLGLGSSQVASSRL